MLKMEEVGMYHSFHMWNLQEETVSPALLAREQDEFHVVGTVDKSKLKLHINVTKIAVIL